MKSASENASFLIIVLSLAPIVQGCGEDARLNSLLDDKIPACTSNVAQIQVMDGFMRRICGCVEDSLAPVKTDLTCTVSAGTTVFFNFQGTTLPHQILPVGSPRFSPTPVNDPSRDEPSPGISPVIFSDVGTYRFRDAFHLLMTGQIVVQ